MIPKSITEVTSLNTLAWSSAVRAGVDQYGHVVTFSPAASRSFDPHNANAPVTPHGRPARASVAMLTAASPSAPAASGQGPWRSWGLPPIGPRSDPGGPARRSTASVLAAIVAKSARLITKAGTTPSI